MKPYLTVLISLIIMIMLTSLQFCLFSYQSHSQFNPVLIGYFYILMTNCSLTILTALALILDMTTYLITGIFGLTILFLVPISWIALKFKDDMYNKIVIPWFCIILYAIFYNIILKWHIAYPIHFGPLFLGIIQNCFLFLMIWIMTKQPLHD